MQYTSKTDSSDIGQVHRFPRSGSHVKEILRLLSCAVGDEEEDERSCTGQ